MTAGSLFHPAGRHTHRADRAGSWWQVVTTEGVLLGTRCWPFVAFLNAEGRAAVVIEHEGPEL